MFTLFKQLNSILSKRDKWHFIVVAFIILFNSVLDLIGVSTILPIVALLTTGEEAIDSNILTRIISKIFNTTVLNEVILYTLLVMIVFFALKLVYSLFYTYAVNRFTLNFSRKMTKRLMETYVMLPYEFHLENNSATLIRKSTYDVGNFTATLHSLLTFFAKTTTAIFIGVYLFITDYLIALIVVGVLIVFSALSLVVLKPHVKKIGKQIQERHSDNYKYLAQAFAGIKESKISNKEKFFTDVYDYNRGRIVYSTLKKNVLTSIPGHSIEFLGMLSVCLSLIVIILFGGSSTIKVVETFAVFAYAVIKLLPAMTDIASTINHINFYKVSVDSLWNDLNQINSKELAEEEKTIVPMPFLDEIKLENVTYFYKTNPDKIVIDNAFLSIKKNTSVAFSGTSGAGKTTIIDVILGLLPCRKGDVLCDGNSIYENLKGWRTNISYIPQAIYLSDDTIRNNVAFGIDKKSIDDKRIWDALEKAQLKEYVESLPDGLDTEIGERGVRMSGGQRQRIGIARAFYRNTNIIVFDEATSALDFDTEKNILENVSRYASDHTLIIITHRLSTIQNCDCIYKIEEGKIERVK